jgi:hypothetical protein
MPKHKTHFSVTNRELTLAVAFAVMGFAFSTRTWLLFLNGLNPLNGLIVYYIVLYASLYGLSRLGLVLFGVKIDKPLQTLGLLCITFAFFITVDWTSQYGANVTGHPNISNIFLQDEDGMAWWAWSLIIPNLELCRIMTFVVTPFLLALAGGALVSKKVRLGL